MTPRLGDELNVNDEPVYDAWSFVDFKLATTRASGRTTHLAPDWTAPHRRRLTAYNVLRAILFNCARRLKTIEGSTPDEMRASLENRQQYREYGDGRTIASGVLSALIGDSQEIVVDGAEEFDPDLAAPADVETLPDGVEPPTPEELAANAEAQRAADLEDWLNAWATDELLPLKLIETEGNAVEYGDGVYSFGFSKEKGRVRVRCYSPDFYFPVLEDGAAEDDFPRRVHIAWEAEDPNDATKVMVRRITWELGPIGATTRGEIDEWRATGVIPPETPSRKLAYADQQTQITCYQTDATFRIAEPRGVEDFSLEDATFATDVDGEVRLRDIGIDFIPVVHVPNTVALLDHYGRSSIAVILQVLDDIANADTDLSKASATTGFPPIVVEGASMNEGASYTPGTVWNLPAGGSVTVVDTSASLDALLKYVESLLKRGSTNAAVPEAWLGRVKPNEVPSGLALRLAFGPLERMVKQMRLVRDAKYPLLLKLVWRLSLVSQVKETPKTWVPARIAFGSFMPADLAAVVEIVSKLRTVTPPAISLESAIGLLIEAGMSLDDAAEEIRRIEERDFDGADKLLTATGDEKVVFDYLGREPSVAPSVPSPPEPTLPPTPGNNG